MNASYSASHDGSSPVWHGTTILTVRKGGKVVIGGDGQISIGQTVIKSNAKKVRKLGKGDVTCGTPTPNPSPQGGGEQKPLACGNGAAIASTRTSA